MKIELFFPTLKEANAFVERHHRHNGPVRGHRISLGLRQGGEVLGVAIIGRPVARMMQDGQTAEVLRVCVPELPGVIGSDGKEHANGLCSKLYAASWRLWRVAGRRLITYALESESGASLRAVGFVKTAEVKPEQLGWGREGREREFDPICVEPKWRWEIQRSEALAA